jgi:hypothetical protein
MWAQVTWLENDLTNGIGKCARVDCYFSMRMLIACAHVVALEEGKSTHEQIFYAFSH